MAIRLFDARGGLVRTATSATMEVAGLVPGLYFVQATAGATTRTQRRAVE